MSIAYFIFTIGLWVISTLNLITRKSNEIFSDSDKTEIKKSLMRVSSFGAVASLFAYLNKYAWEHLVFSAGVTVLIGIITIGFLILMLFHWAVTPSIDSVKHEIELKQKALEKKNQYEFYKKNIIKL